MQETPLKLDALSEMLALSSYGNTKNLLITAIEVSGPLDKEAVKLAIQRATRSFPQFVSRIKEVRERSRHYLVWDHDPDMTLPLTTLDARTYPFTSVLNGFIQRITPALDRDWDLFNEPPAEINILKLSEDRHILALVIHHVVSDAGTASEFGRELLAHYHENITGQKPDWPCQQRAISSIKKRMVHTRGPNLRSFLVGFREAMKHFIERSGLPLGSGSASDRQQHLVKRVISAQETERIGKLCSEKRVSLVDILVAGIDLTIDEWNEARNVTPGILTTSISVNMKGRFREFEKANNSALMVFKSRPEERRDLDALAWTTALKRRKYFSKHMDLKFFQNVSRMTSALRIFPFPVRRRIVNFLMNRHQFSAAVTLLGTIWPQVDHEKDSSNSCLTSTGGLRITEVHGVGYKLLSNTPLLLIVYSFRGRLNLVLHAAGTLFTRRESEEFMDIMTRNLLNYAQDVPVSGVAVGWGNRG
jgi:NRPS condensation-like uncharacterized protein